MDKEQHPNSEFLVISRGQWDADAAPHEIEDAITRFYAWLDQNIAAGKMRAGHRLATSGAIAGRHGQITDGPYGEGKEVVGGYWFILAADLREAVALAAQNPCTRFGIFFEIRPLEYERASVYHHTNETPSAWNPSL
jgi:hypothetical protein